eukprot:scaffold1954_cov268-Pinguiococcus_pyrenoidosus.AAC.152
MEESPAPVIAAQLGQERLAQVQQEERAASQAVRQLEKELTNEQVDYESQVRSRKAARNLGSEGRLAIAEGAGSGGHEVLPPGSDRPCNRGNKGLPVRTTTPNPNQIKPNTWPRAKRFAVSRFNTRELTSQITDIEGKEAMEAVVSGSCLYLGSQRRHARILTTGSVMPCLGSQRDDGVPQAQTRAARQAEGGMGVTIRYRGGRTAGETGGGQQGAE